MVLLRGHCGDGAGRGSCGVPAERATLARARGHAASIDGTGRPVKPEADMHGLRCERMPSGIPSLPGRPPLESTLAAAREEQASRTATKMR